MILNVYSKNGIKTYTISETDVEKIEKIFFNGKEIVITDKKSLLEIIDYLRDASKSMIETVNRVRDFFPMLEDLSGITEEIDSMTSILIEDIYQMIEVIDQKNTEKVSKETDNKVRDSNIIDMPLLNTVIDDYIDNYFDKATYILLGRDDIADVLKHYSKWLANK